MCVAPFARPWRALLGLARPWRTLLGLALLCLACGLLRAQTDDLEADFKKPDAQEFQRLSTLMNEPVPEGLSGNALSQYFWDKELAARILGDVTRREAILRAGVAALNQPGMKRNLGQLLLSKGQLAEGNALMLQAAQEGGSVENAFASATMVCDFYTQNRDAEARKLATEVDGKIGNLMRRVKDVEKQVMVWRAASRRDACLSMLEDRVGHTQQAIEFARSADQYARMALNQIASQSLAAARAGVLQDVSGAIARRLDASLAVDHLNDAESALKEYVRFSAENQLPAGKLADVYEHAGRLRLAQREFPQAERWLRKADGVWAGMGARPQARMRIIDMRDTLQALIGQRRWAAALAELDRLDQVPVADGVPRQFPLLDPMRGLVYLHSGRADAALAPLQDAATRALAQYGAGHFYLAEARGLQGVALWRSSDAAQRDSALALLKEAVRDYMAPANADFQIAIGIRREVRELVFSAYLDAAAHRSVQDALEAMGPADWARGGVVKDALNDAAVRSSASTPALADVVRREQDAKNEIAGLRRFLSGELGASASPLPQVAAQMRERIAVLETERTRLQAELKTRFPSYERLVHPQAPTVQEVARQLGPDQALVLILPSADAVYVWAISSDRPVQFAQAPISQARVNQLVATLRRQLDFGSERSAGTRFDSAAAFELYHSLLAPMDAVLGNKHMIIVAAGGALSQLPFGLLQTQANGGVDADAPWLIRQTSVSQVPSLSSWLAIKSLARAKSAAQAFAGWGDPAFDLQTAQAAPGASATRSVLPTRAMAPSADADALLQEGQGLTYSQIPSLPDTREELQAIAAALKADAGQDLLLGAAATRASVLQASQSGALLNKRVLAFATHGLMAGDLPQLTQPALALAATGHEDQQPLGALLTLEDVLTLKLNADWVVLSACNSAAEDGRGDEVMSGLARGFFYAGSRALLVTHWAVESESARLLTTETFRHYAAHPEAPKAESLRQAMLAVMAMPQYRHPAFWAPYALVGDGGR